MLPLDIPLYLQGIETSYCVPYSLVGIAEYYGIKVSKQDMIKACKCSKKGACCVDYTDGIKQFGLKFERIKFNYKGIRKTLKQGHPVVFSYRTTEWNHFTTIVGAQRNKRGLPTYTLNDTYHGQYDLPSSILMFIWKQRKSWARKVVYL